MEPTHQSQLTGQSPPSRPGSPARAGLTYALFVVAALAAGLILRLWMLNDLFQVNGDSLIYGDLGKTSCCTGTMPDGR